MQGLDNQIYYRLFFSLGGLLLFWSMAVAFPFRKKPAFSDLSRISSNLCFSFGNGIILKLIVPTSLFALSQDPLFAFKRLVSLSNCGLLGIILGVLLLDLSIYWQHRFAHWVGPLWRLHRMHHSDIEIDTSSAGRFHILEIILSFFYKAFWVILFNIPATAIIIFEILLNFGSLFNHSNFQIPKKFEKLLRWIVITPDLHRIHHSVLHQEMNKNFGFSISLWDRLFGTYSETSHQPQQSMEIGLVDFRKPEEQNFLALLKQPFLKK